MDGFPQEFCQFRILPLLLQAFEFSNAGSAILNPLLKVRLMKQIQFAYYQTTLKKKDI